MAFVSESQRENTFLPKSTSGPVGPGDYHNEGLLHKQAMQAIYPKKGVPFNSQNERKTTQGPYNDTPGPGHYRLKSDFEMNQYIKSMDDKGTYLTIENGHLNQKRQMYSKFEDPSSSQALVGPDGTRGLLDAMKRVKSTLPGPGSYETNISSCVSTDHTRKMQQNRSNVHLKSGLLGSPHQSSIMNESSQHLVGLSAIQSTPGLGFGSSTGKCDAPGVNVSTANQKLANLSIPTIPSRFLTPILKFDLNENERGYDLYDTVIGANQGGDQPDSILVAKVARLTNDGSGVGPGSYNPKAKYSQARVKGAPAMATDKTMRGDHFVKSTAALKVGPGSYSIKHEIDRSIQNPTIARRPIFRTADQRTKRRKNKGSIRADFEEGDTTSEEGPMPGPGHHLQEHHTSTFNKQHYLHDHPQQFGTCGTRFTEEIRNHSPGPGQYLSQNILKKFEPKQGGVEGTSTFKAPGRKGGPMEAREPGSPGPQDYVQDSTKKSIKKPGNRHPFDVNVQRFKKSDNDVPGAGTYTQPSTMKVHNPKHLSATFKSNIDKSLDLVQTKDAPGAGEYETQNHKAIANKEFQGGAANNFVLFTRQNYQVRNPRIVEQPRIAKLEERTPAMVGPGSYIGKQEKTFNTITKPKYVPNLQFGTDRRFKYEAANKEMPGPGQYNDQNKWNQRTYNLKFLNFQANALQNNAQGQNSNREVHGRSRSLQLGGQKTLENNLVAKAQVATQQ